MRTFFAPLLAMVLVGCVSTEMKSYIGQDIGEVILVNGPPINEMEMGNGVRAFQFRWGGGTIAMPETTRTTGTVTNDGSSAQIRANSVTTPGYTVESEGCTISYLAKRDESRDAWIIFDYRYPKRMVC